MKNYIQDNTYLHTDENAPKRRSKSVLITIGVACLLLVVLYFVRFWPPANQTEELIAQGGGGGGMTINFGDTEQGKGADYQNEELNVAEKNQTQAAQEETPEEILTQDNVGENVETPTKNTIKTPKPKDPKPITKPVVQQQIPIKKPNSALANLLKGKNKSGDGNSNTAGNQGNKNGSKISDGYYGNGKGGKGKGGGRGNGNGEGDGDGKGPGRGKGSGGDGKANFSLAGRRLVTKPAVDNDCNSFGTVVIKITVNKTGKTILAVNGRGTKADACLITLAKKFAINTKWDASESAAEKQTGTITYNFSN